MSPVVGTLDTLIPEIEEVYRDPLPDYRGRAISKEHVLNYLLSSYHRTQEIVGIIRELDRDKRILDLGIGYGFYDIILKTAYGFDICGMEIPANIPAYCRLPQAHGIPIIPGELSATRRCPLSDESFDVVILAEVFEHLRVSPLRALVEIRRILRPEGLLLLTTPNIARLSNILSLLRAQNIIESLPDDDAGLNHITDNMTHIREYTMQELTVLMTRAGYKIIKSVHSSAPDRAAPRERYGWRKRLARLMSKPALILVPSFRSLLVVVGRKVEEAS
ncbi:MAG TPA: class I SAM-dependent methyltransferase [Phycisphaerae bacterium]|nr:class I SAM-dependent methyltransferase [Phycisphaerae bacterium]